MTTFADIDRRALEKRADILFGRIKALREEDDHAYNRMLSERDERGVRIAALEADLRDTVKLINGDLP